MDITSLILVIPVILAVALVIMIVRRNITEKGSRDIDIAGAIPAVVILFVAVILISGMAASSNPTYSFDSDSGELTIKQNIEAADSYPWSGYAADVKEITIRGGVTEVPAGALSMLTSVEAVTIPSSLSDPSGIFGVSFADPSGESASPSAGFYAGPGDGTVYRCVEEAFTYSGSAITGLSSDYSTAAYVVLPAKHGSTALTSVADQAFFQKTRIAFLGSAPDSSISALGSSSVRGCTALATVALPDSLATVGSHAFDGCTSLSDVRLPSSLRTLSNDAFRSCTSLEEVSLPEGLLEIGDAAFGLSGLESLTIPRSVVTIATNAVAYSQSLASVTFLGSPSVGGNAFNNCSAIESVTFPQGFDATLAATWAPGWTFYEADGTTEVIKTYAAALAGHTFTGTASALVMQS